MLEKSRDNDSVAYQEYFLSRGNGFFRTQIHTLATSAGTILENGFIIGLSSKDLASAPLDDFTNDNTAIFLNTLGIDTGLNEPIDEISSMAGGSVQGYSLPLGAKPKRKKKKDEYYEPELYKEVLNLLIKKGILQ